jgi:hypothetical protein
MAITISQQPTSPNMANNNLVFTISSPSASNAQYQYIADIQYSASVGVGTSLQLIKQQPNPYGYGVFDIGQIINNYLDSDNIWKAAPFRTNTNTAKRFKVIFGEEWATSISGAAIEYNGQGQVGPPAVSGSNYYYIINGLVDPYNKVNWNWPSGSYFTGSAVSTTTTFNVQHALTNAPTTQNIQDGEYATISLINGNFTNSTSSAQDIFVVRVRSYDATGSLLDDVDLSNLVSNGGGPRANGTQVWSNVAASQTQATQLLNIGVGPQNLADAGDPLGSTWAYYIVQPVGQQSAGVVNYSGSYATIRYEKQGPICGYDGVRFAWKNEYGVWDYFTFTLNDSEDSTIERQGYTQTFVNFGTAIDSVPYDKQRRGALQFYNKLATTQKANSNWLSQDEADWLKELFYSANVFQQVGSDFFPIVITSSTLVEKRNPRTQKLFQYEIEFQPANQPNARL